MRIFFQKRRFSFLFPFLKFAALPLLVAIYPAVFHFANNARLVLFSSLLELCIFLAGIGMVLYLTLSITSRGMFFRSAVGATLILAFFHVYGIVFEWLRLLDLFQVETVNFLPFYVFVALYLAWQVMDLNTKISFQVWSFSVLLVGVLITFNIAKIVPIEIKKNIQNMTGEKTPEEQSRSLTNNEQYPDIYYIMFDEAVGFEAARQYFGFSGVDEFVSFLKSNDFYVAEKSYSGSIVTMREIATRFNYFAYPITYENYEIYTEPLEYNQGMQYLKSLGYTTIVFQEPQLVLPAAFPIISADIVFNEPPNELKIINVGFMDDFKRMVMERTLLQPLVITLTPNLEKHKDFIFYAMDNFVSLQISSPKFVYIHLLLPHAPFMFDENGGFTEQTVHYSWRAYLGTYRYSLKLAQRMIQNILESVDHEHPPVIIFQSDHGARNLTNKPFSEFLEDYPEEYKTLIVNAIHLPGCDEAPLSQNLDPINTFPIIFNCYFDAGIPLK